MLAKDEQTEAQISRTIQELRSKWNAPPRHYKTKPRLDGEFGEVLKRVRSKVSTGFFCALVGARGNGKTQIGVELMKFSTAELRSAFYETATGFFLRVKESYRKNSDSSERAVISEFRKPAMLVIDEIGKRSDVAWENRLLFHLFDCRYMDEKDTLIISNQSEAEFEDSLDASLASRMKQTGGIIACNWAALR